ncbi:MAG: flagellar biosynthesis protein FlhF [Spirochaetaceae bacterium]|jgi:flagellar biosynthesis protein FlhF|nr:flagellar biosynthesis protein FlhF [Spirochaetaceae bacterium]
MNYFTEQGLTEDECRQKIRMKYGERARVMIQKSIRIGGIFGFFAKDGVEMTGIIPKEYPPYTAAAPSPPLDFQKKKEEVLAAAARTEKTDPVQEKTDVIQQTILKAVLDLKKKIDSPQEDHPTLTRIGEILDLNDFSPAYSRKILDRIKKEFSLEILTDYDQVQDTVVDWIGESITLYNPEPPKMLPRIMVLVGPTGVGKTTTIAKLAAVFGPGNKGSRPLSVRMVTIDNYRIGAKLQVETYGDIMNIPVSCVDNYADLKKTIALYAEGVDLILVDTIGKNPRDSVEIAEMKQMLSACGSAAEIHLVMAATTKYSDMREIFQQFEPFNYRSVIITKLDETIRVGNVISALADKGKSIFYITNGQHVPDDLVKAGVIPFLINLEDFKINRDRITKRFSDGESENAYE